MPTITLPPVSALARITAALTAVLLLAATAAAVGSAPAALAAGDSDVTWGVRTAADHSGADRQNFGYRIRPGDSIEDALVVSNHSARPITLDVYAADGFTTASGQLDVAKRDAEPTAVGAWTAVRDGTVTIEPAASVEVPFTLAVPRDATPGDYAGGILTSLPSAAQEGGVSVDRRLGIRIHVRVDGTLTPAVAVEQLRVEYTGTFDPFGAGAATVSYTVHNTGNVRLSAGQTVVVSGPLGLFAVDAGPIAAVPELLPGESWTVSVPVRGVVPAFWLTATATLAPKLPAVAGATPGVQGAAVTAGTWAAPWALLVLLLLVAGAVAAALAVGRRRRRGAPHARRESRDS